MFNKLHKQPETHKAVKYLNAIVWVLTYTAGGNNPQEHTEPQPIKPQST
jgi:hypothetical protein